jgi:hypothetical protein
MSQDRTSKYLETRGPVLFRTAEHELPVMLVTSLMLTLKTRYAAVPSLDAVTKPVEGTLHDFAT